MIVAVEVVKQRFVPAHGLEGEATVGAHFGLAMKVAPQGILLIIPEAVLQLGGTEPDTPSENDEQRQVKSRAWGCVAANA